MRRMERAQQSMPRSSPPVTSPYTPTPAYLTMTRTRLVVFQPRMTLYTLSYLDRHYNCNMIHDVLEWSFLHHNFHFSSWCDICLALYHKICRSRHLCITTVPHYIKALSHILPSSSNCRFYSFEYCTWSYCDFVNILIHCVALVWNTVWIVPTIRLKETIEWKSSLTFF